ncbi:MAG: phosphoenolpyruvate synthase, partial [Planctomycetes bacterium]|nr:phosphoenolpyruvate synthase [Planctomycetota bacterium]
ISAAWGLGETVVQGEVNPDKYVVFKSLLENERAFPIIEKSCGTKAIKLVYAKGGSKRTKIVATTPAEQRRFVLEDEEIVQLARWSVAVERHYGRAMDMEWAKDGESGLLYLVQARPETVQSRSSRTSFRIYSMKTSAEPIVEGAAVGSAIAAGKACVIKSVADIDRFPDGAILVTGNTDPDWVPVMRRASGIVTDHGGNTSHAAIVSRELGVPAVVGTGDATGLIADGQDITLSCAGGETGRVFGGQLPFTSEEVDVGRLPETRTEVMVNIADPSAAFDWWRLPARGVGLARMEFIINNQIKIHPMALVHPERVESAEAREQIDAMTAGWQDKTAYFVDQLARGIARIAAVCHPKPVIVRMSDFKTNEYAELIGGSAFEPAEANPMLGWRGASRYYSDGYREAFALECQAIRKAREQMGLDNIVIMIPFCRTPEEADRVLKVLAENGLVRGRKGLEVYVMAEIPSNVLLADAFSERFDGFSIGSNDLTQLVLGVDRDSDLLAHLFDDRHEAVRRAISSLIEPAHRHGRQVGLCGQAPSDHPEFARFLVKAGIDSISINPDSFVTVKRQVADAEAGSKPR